MDTYKGGHKNAYIIKILVTVILFIELGHGKAETMNEKCDEENNTTLICNYIPKSLKRQYHHVRIFDFKRENKLLSINSSSFTDKSWTKVHSIEFNDSIGMEASRGCFQGLRSLKELRIHVADFHLDAEAFIGLPLVHTLDVSKCVRLSLEDISNALKDKSTLPGLKNLILAEIGDYRSINNTINSKNAAYLLQRNITNFDISRTQIHFINITAVSKILKTSNSHLSINISQSVIAELAAADIDSKDLINIRELDLSHLVLPASALPFAWRYVMSHQTVKYSDITFKNDLQHFFTPSIVNMSMILSNRVSMVGCYNCTIMLDEPLNWKVKQLILRKNNVKYLDVKIVCQIHKLTSIHHLDLSENGLELIHPMACLPNLEIFVLSKNKLFRMLANEPRDFEKLFASFSKLREINLSNNNLSKVPENLFKYNRNIEIIDLSFNDLVQVHSDLKDLHRLRVFDVRNNMIKVLDEVSINSLNGIPCVDDYCSVLMASNPFLCSTCSCKSSIDWLLSSTLGKTDQQALQCITENEVLVNVDESIPRKIQAICNRKIVIIVTTVGLIVFFLIVSTTGFLLYRRYRKHQRKRKMDTVIARFITGEEQYEFVAFLSYSSMDDQFVQDHVIDPLNENLRLMIGTDRDLVCTGDQHLRPGFRVFDDTDLCLDRASVVIVVVSDNFCRSSYCRMEFDQAYLKKKPIVLMLLGHVDEELMMPTLKTLYKRDVRILWKNENGQFVLTTTWENVCSSVLEKVEI